jgi:hypothetical protein
LLTLPTLPILMMKLLLHSCHTALASCCAVTQGQLLLMWCRNAAAA